MRKITFAVLGLFFATNGLLAQTTYSTGIVPFFGGGATSAYSGKVDVTNTTVTITLTGPSTSWMGVGFNTSGMDGGSDVVIFDGTTLSDRHFDGLGNTPLVDTQQNWSLVSNNVGGGIRTAVISRSRTAVESGDFSFSFPPNAFNIVFARSIGLTFVSYHGSGNCGTTTLDFTLGTDSFDIRNSKIYPNPANDFVTIELPDSVYEADILVYDMQGRKVKETSITLENNKIDLTGLNSGSYLLNVKTVNGEGSKILVIN